jgi:GH35 family endo-1,4-beta-xylanase
MTANSDQSGTVLRIQYLTDVTATADPLASTLMLRDASGRVQAASPAAGADIATKSYVDTAIAGAVVADDSVSNAKLTNVASASLKGRISAGAGDPEDLTAVQVRSLLNVADGATAAGVAGDAFAATHPGSGGSAHATATASAAGFLAAADKAKLDAATASATAATLMLRDASGRVQVADPSAPADVATRSWVERHVDDATSCPKVVFGTYIDPRSFSNPTDPINWSSQSNGVGALAKANFNLLTHGYGAIGYNCTAYDPRTNTLTYDAPARAKFDAVVNFALSNGQGCHVAHLFWANGQQPGAWFRAAPAATLTLGAMSGAGVSASAGSAVFASTDVGKVIVSGNGAAVIVSYTSSTAVTVNITAAFGGTSIGSGAWSLQLSRTDALNACYKYIDDIFVRYDGKVTAYNVVNELFGPNGGARTENNPYDAVIGSDWARLVCQHARTVANSLSHRPTLIWCDFNTYSTAGIGGGPTIRSNMLAELDGMPAGTIDAVGEQGHLAVARYDSGGFDMAAWDSFLSSLSSRNIDLWITELDMQDGVFTKSGTAVQYTDAQCASIMDTFLSHAFGSAICKGVILWGCNVASSWSIDILASFYSDYGGMSSGALPPKPTFGGVWQAKPNSPAFASGGIVNGSAAPAGKFYAIDPSAGSGTPPNLDGLGVAYNSWTVLGVYGRSGSTGTKWNIASAGMIRSDGSYTNGVMFDENNTITSVGQTIQYNVNAAGGNLTSFTTAYKAMLDGATASATANTLAIRDSAGRLQVASPSAALDAAPKVYVDQKASGSTVQWLSGGAAYTLPDPSNPTTAVRLVNVDVSNSSAISGTAISNYYGGAKFSGNSGLRFSLNNKISIGQKWQIHLLFKIPSLTTGHNAQTLFMLNANYNDVSPAPGGAIDNNFVIDYYRYTTNGNDYVRVYRRDQDISKIIGFWPITLNTMYQFVVTYDGTQISPIFKGMLNGSVSDPGSTPAAPNRTANYDLCRNWTAYVGSLATGWGYTVDNAWIAGVYMWPDLDDLTIAANLSKYWSGGRPVDVSTATVGSGTYPIIVWNAGASTSSNSGTAGGTWTNANPTQATALTTSDTDWLAALSSIDGGNFSLATKSTKLCLRQTPFSTWYCF